MASQPQAQLPGHAKDAGGDGAPEPIAPLYARLPHGPHQLERAEVMRHQRMRIHGAMVEAVARNGYAATSVRQLIALAGVSRRSFYEHFANKHDCFMATFDMLAAAGIRRMGAVAPGGDARPEHRLDAALRRLGTLAQEKRKATELVLLEAQTLGASGVRRLRDASAACERLLARSFAGSRAGELPVPILRGIGGGLYGMVSARLRTAAELDGARLGEELTRWALLFDHPASGRVARRLARQVPARMREVAGRRRAPMARRPDVPDGERERLLRAVLALAHTDGYGELETARIADEAGVAPDGFFERFDGKEECFLAALEAIAGQLLELMPAAQAGEGEWPQAVRRSVRRLTGFLAARPLHARTITELAFSAGERAVALTVELIDELAARLCAGACGAPRAERDAVAGALLHTVRCHASGTGIELLPVLSDHLAYVVLTPRMGAEGAADAVTGRVR